MVTYLAAPLGLALVEGRLLRVHVLPRLEELPRQLVKLSLHFHLRFRV